MEFLKAIFGDKTLNYDDFVQAINAHNGNEANKDKMIKLANLGGGEYVSKMKYEDIVQQLSGKQTEIDTANGLIAELKKGTKGNEELQGKISGYETQVTQLQEQLRETQISSEFKIALLAAGAKKDDIDYLDYKLKAKGDKLELGEDGHIKGIDDMIAGLKTQFPNQFDSTSWKPIIEPNTLPTGTHNQSTVTKEQFDKMGYQSRLKLKQEQPDVYAQMTGKAE